MGLPRLQIGKTEPRRVLDFAKTPDWFVVDWIEVYNRLGFAPYQMPGVSTDSRGRAEVHRSVLPVIGYEAPGALSRELDAAADPILRAHQVEAFRFIRGRFGTLLADEMRVGKSASIMYAHEPKDGICLVIGPVAARLTWHEWSARRFGWCGEEDCSTCTRVAHSLVKGQGETFPHGLPVEERPSFGSIDKVKFDPERLETQAREGKLPHTLFMSFAVARGWGDLYSAGIPIGTLVVDEAHLAGVQNKNNLTVMQIRKIATVAKRVVLATGTPLYNRPKGLWPLLDIAAPGSFGSFREFAFRYCAAAQNAYGYSYDGASNQDELRKRLSEIMLRRTWAEIAENLPALTRTPELIALSRDQQEEIEALSAKASFSIGQMHTVVGDLARLRRAFGEAKLPAALLATHRFVEENNRGCILWFWHRDLAIAAVERLREMGTNAISAVVGPLHGQVKASDREAMQASAFEYAQSRPVVFVATMAACATAVNLSFANHEIFAELDWTPTTIMQAEMRPYNGSQPISASYLIADCPTDRRMGEALLAKLEVARDLGLSAGVGDAADVLRSTLKNGEEAGFDALAERLFATVLSEE